MAPHPLPTNLNIGCDGVLLCMAEWANDVTGGMFWVVVLLGFCVVLFIAAQRFGTPRAFGFSSFVGVLGSIFLVTLGLMPYWIASGFILLGVIGLASMVISER